MKKGLIEELEITTKMPKNRTAYTERHLGNLFLQAGFVSDSGNQAKVELRSMLRLVDIADYCYKTPSYKWHALNLVIKKAAKPEYFDGTDSSQHFHGVKFEVSEYLTLLTNQMCRKHKGAIILYRWHVEYSAKGGWHTHIAMFLNGSSFHAGGFNTLQVAKKTLRDNKNLDYSLVSVNASPWSRSREREAAQIYFDELEYSLPHADDEFTFGLRLKTLNDYRYMLYVFSYQTKFHTKELQDLGEDGHNGFTEWEVRTWSNGTPVPKKAKKRSAANDAQMKRVA